MTVRGFAFVAVCAVASIGCGSGSSHASHAAIYTAEQAGHGKDVYTAMCVSCHAGMANHTGPVFRVRWGGQTVEELYRFISENMPKNDPGTLSPDEYASVVAYLLQLNGMPAGTIPLPTDTIALRTMMIDTTVATR